MLALFINKIKALNLLKTHVFSDAPTVSKPIAIPLPPREEESSPARDNLGAPSLHVLFPDNYSFHSLPCWLPFMFNYNEVIQCSD